MPTNPDLIVRIVAHSYRLEPVRRSPYSVRAVCSCGWRGDPMPSAGLAGTSWDMHAEKVRADG